MWEERVDADTMVSTSAPTKSGANAIMISIK